MKTITGLKRLNNTPNGGPRWDVTFNDGLVTKTLSDSTIGFAISEVEHLGAKVDVDLNRKGEIIAMTIVERAPRG